MTLGTCHPYRPPSLRRALPERFGRLIVVHRKSREQLPTTAIARGVEALDVERFVLELAGTKEPESPTSAAVLGGRMNRAARTLQVSVLEGLRPRPQLIAF